MSVLHPNARKRDFGPDVEGKEPRLFVLVLYPLTIVEEAGFQLINSYITR